MLKSIVLILLLTASALAKDRQWQTGTVTDFQPYHIYEKDKGVDCYRLRVEDDKYSFQGNYVPSLPWNKKPRVTVNAPIRFSVEKNSLYVIDEDKRECKLNLERKAVKTASTTR